MALRRCEVAVIGSGFAGSLLARVLARQGRDVVLLERGAHPRFALGESSTPLAALALERLARRYDLPDLAALGVHGRFKRELPELRCGRKRGFTFYGHAAAKPYANDAANSSRLLVAASASDEVADVHWLRADVDHHLVGRAVAAGVDYRDRTELADLDVDGRGVRLRGRRDGTPVEFAADFVVDASGPGGFLRRRLPIASALRRTATRSALVFSHFRGVRPFATVAREQGAALPRGPYPDDWAALHHLFAGGWMYVLRFDDGVVSAGFLLAPAALARLGGAAAGRPEDLWRALLGRYPSIAAQFADAEPLFPIGFSPRIQHRLARAAGPRWALLPHTYAFVDPLFSTGIAWSVLGVERLARSFEEAPRGRLPAQRLDRYAARLAAEADQIDRLVAGAYLALGDFALSAAHAMLYFATVSYAEERQRRETGEGTAWEGFLGIGDPVLEPLFGEAVRRLRALRGKRAAGAAGDFAAWVAGAIAPRNVAGLMDPRRRNMYPKRTEGHALAAWPSDGCGGRI